jgi:crotonobetainyl-CoA:carnitine CoA-transferase CaiB-like acyl-CoA transferase
MSLLAGMLVADFTRVFSGPAATQLLADYGADVVKIEDPRIGDDARVFGLGDNSSHPAGGASASFVALNRNKRSIGLDLKNDAGRAVAMRICARADVLVHNFRPGVIERLGFGYDALSATNPGLVYCEISGYGREGPLAARGANDIALQAHSGLMSITGEAGGPPVRCGSAVVDLHCGMSAVAGIFAALLHRERTGKGQRVETSLLAAGANLMTYFYQEYWLDGTIPRAMGSANALTVPNQAFPTSDGAAIIIGSNDEMWLRCARTLDIAALDQPEFRSVEGRRANRDRLVALLSGITRRHTTDALVTMLDAAKVVAAPVRDVGRAAEDPQLRAIGQIAEYETEGRAIKSVAPPFRLGATPAVAPCVPPALAADTDPIARQFGYSPNEIAELRATGAFG